MNCTCKVDQRRLTPGVFNLKQYLNGTETMVWTLDNCVVNEGTCDLNEYDAFLTLNVGGRVDEIMLTKQQTTDGKLQLLWDVGTYATALKGYVKYQIVFRGKCTSDLSVVMPNTLSPAHGNYAIDSMTVEGYHRTWTSKTSAAHTIQFNSEANRWEILKGAEVVSYQTFASVEPYGGTWDKAIVGNSTAYTWQSLEAVMFISESVAADERVAAGCPTILRQVFDGMRNLCAKSGVTALSDWVYTTSWYSSSSPYYVNLHDLFSIPAGCLIVEVRVQRENADGTLTDVDSIEVVEDNGKAKLYCNEKINAKITVSVRSAGGSYIFVDEKSVGHVGGWRIDKAGIAAELPDYAGEKAGFVFYATDTGMYYRKQSDTSGDWSQPYPFRGEQGTPGATGRPGKDGVSEVYVYNAIEEHNEANTAHAELFAGKANKTHTHAMSEISGLSDALGKKASTASVTNVATRVTNVEKTIGDINAALAAIVGE